MADSIADMLTIVRNAQAVRKETVKVPFSNMKLNLAKLLEKEGFVERVERKGSKTKPVLILTLRYNPDGSPRIHELKRVSKPGQRQYVGYRSIRNVKEGFGRAIISTPRGLLTDAEARKEQVGGEYICEIW